MAGSIYDFVAERNRIQLIAESKGKEAAKQCWVELGVANRHIERVLDGKLPLSSTVEGEITACLQRVEKWMRGCLA